MLKLSKNRTASGRVKRLLLSQQVRIKQKKTNPKGFYIGRKKITRPRTFINVCPEPFSDHGASRERMYRTARMRLDGMGHHVKDRVKPKHIIALLGGTEDVLRIEPTLHEIQAGIESCLRHDSFVCSNSPLPCALYREDFAKREASMGRTNQMQFSRKGFSPLI